MPNTLKRSWKDLENLYNIYMNNKISSNKSPKSSNELIGELAKNIIDEGKVVWKNVLNIFSLELKKNEEGIHDAFLNNWSNYSKGYGIEIQRAADPEKKLLLSIHEYRHFLNGNSGAYSILEEDIDADVRKDVNKLIKLLDKKDNTEAGKETVESIKNLKKTFDFNKFFNGEK